MEKEVQRYVNWLTATKENLESEIATKKRSLEIVTEKLANPEKHLAKELGRGAVKVSRVLAGEEVKKPKTVLKKKSESLAVPAQETTVPAGDFVAGAEMTVDMSKVEEKKGSRGILGGLFT